jgi:hypothetical protein
MFQSIKRARFLSNAAPQYDEIFCRNLAEDHLEMQHQGFPANEFVDIYMAAKCPESDFPIFLNNLLHFARLGEVDGELTKWAAKPNVRSVDKQGLTNLLKGST